MTTLDVLKFSRNLLLQGRAVETASFGDWPEAVAIYDAANRWRFLLWKPRTRWGAIRSLDRAIRMAERHAELQVFP